MRTLVIGDIHGAYKALDQVLGRAKFNPKTDKLICLGDVADGWPQTPECIELLRGIASHGNLVYVMGNHDKWFDDWLRKGKKEIIWIMQGGEATYQAYVFRHQELIKEHQNFFRDHAKPYHVENKKLFVHGGFNPVVPIETQNRHDLMWDRALWDNLDKWSKRKCGEYEEVYVGHTSVWPNEGRNKKHGSEVPKNVSNIWFMDTGAGWEGKLSVMDIDSKEVWQSDLVSDLYPETRGRN